MNVKMSLDIRRVLLQLGIPTDLEETFLVRPQTAEDSLTEHKKTPKTGPDEGPGSQLLQYE